MARTAAALVIGNEILTGKIQDTNVACLARELFSLGVELRRVIVCPDEVATIVADLDALRKSHDLVVTSGGVGPTHDDVTLEAVARCFGRALVRSRELEDLIRGYVGERCTEGHLRQADIPEGARLLSSAEVRWPTVVVENVFVMPGLPKIFQMKLPLLRDYVGADVPFLSRSIYTLCHEAELAESLDVVAAEHTDVAIGSYPVLGVPEYKVKLTVDGTDQVAVDRAVEALLAALPEDKVVEKPKTG
jgi:molybdenum cofactor synthesis domain-containing protein